MRDEILPRGATAARLRPTGGDFAAAHHRTIALIPALSDRHFGIEAKRAHGRGIRGSGDRTPRALRPDAKACAFPSGAVLTHGAQSF